MKGLLTIPLFVASTYAEPLFTSKKLASQHLTRHRRDNGGIFEEVGGGNLERECIEEICSLDEVREATNTEAEAQAFWQDATRTCEKPDSCHREGTKTCVNKWRGRICQCKEGWKNTDTADNCSTDIDECANENYCFNGGVCTNLIGSFNCECPVGWTGARCDQDVNECEAEQNPCANGGACTNTDGGFTCDCPDNWTGDLCDVDVDECLNDPCQNNSGCLNNAGSYECVCNNGWGGQNCDEDFDECGMNLCPEGSVCRMLEQNQFTCECPERGCNNADEVLYNSKLEQIAANNAPEEEATVEETNDDFYDTNQYDEYTPADNSTEESTDNTYSDNYGIVDYSAPEDNAATEEVVDEYAAEPTYDAEVDNSYAGYESVDAVEDNAVAAEEPAVDAAPVVDQTADVYASNYEYGF